MEASEVQILIICFPVIDQSISFGVLKLSHFVPITQLFARFYPGFDPSNGVYLSFVFFPWFLTVLDARTKTSLVSRTAEVQGLYLPVLTRRAIGKILLRNFSVFRRTKKNRPSVRVNWVACLYVLHNANLGGMESFM